MLQPIPVPRLPSRNSLNRDLAALADAFADTTHLVFVQAHLDADDTPPLIDALARLATAAKG